MKKWKRTGAIIHARSGECAPVVCIASSVEHARLIEVAPRLLRALQDLMSDVGYNSTFPSAKRAKAAIKRAMK